MTLGSSAGFKLQTVSIAEFNIVNSKECQDRYLYIVQIVKPINI